MGLSPTWDFAYWHRLTKLPLSSAAVTVYADRMNTLRASKFSPLTRPLRQLTLVGLGAALMLTVGCADDPRSVSLVVEHDFGVTFENMAIGVQHSNEPDAIVTTDDLRTEAAYTQLRDELVCMGLDTTASFIKIDQLQKPGADAPPFVYSVDIRAVGETQWQLLAELDADIVNNQTHFFDDATMTVVKSGVSKLAELALSERPQYEVRFVGTANAPISSLSVEVHLEMKFSNQTAECP